MVNYVKRLIYVDATEKQKINPLFYPFLWATFVYGLGFVVFGSFNFVSVSSLFQAFYTIHPWLPRVWGGFAIVAGAAAMALLLLRHGKWGDIASMFGFLVWLFALIVYALNGFWLVLLTVTVPNLYFWVYYYFKVKWYMRSKEAGFIRDPG
jgi:hypothetical protein